MNNIPTPRTEAVMVDPLSDGNDLPQLARKLETELSEVLRERDEAREKAERYRIEANAMMMQRDEAREKNAKLHYIVERAINYLDQSYRDGFADEVSDLRYEIEQLKEETK
jgi:hypothetical protein